jgi:hypothetical protein
MMTDPSATLAIDDGRACRSLPLRRDGRRGGAPSEIVGLGYR